MADNDGPNLEFYSRREKLSTLISCQVKISAKTVAWKKLLEKLNVQTFFSKIKTSFYLKLKVCTVRLIRDHVRYCFRVKFET